MDVTFRMLALLFQNNSHMHKKFFSTQSKSFWYRREGVTRKDYVEKKTAMKTFHYMVTLFLHLIMPEILGNFPGTELLAAL